MKAVVLYVLSLLTFSLCDIHIHCPDQSEACECSKDAHECEFTFNVSQRFSFVSYKLDEDQALTETGCLLILDQNGYHPAVAMGGAIDCSILDGIMDDSQFKAKNHSIPMTLDGENYRSLILINGRIPGPTLIVYEHQTVVVHVNNYLTDIGISIHWHGMYQRRSVWMDGVSHVTQPPIDPDSSFDYIFKAEPAGTHWYHSHTGSQKSDGLFGAFIVRENDKTLGDILDNNSYINVIDQPAQHTLSLTDWQRKPEAIHQALSSIPFFTDISVGMLPPSQREMFQKSEKGHDGASLGPFPFWSGLINGRGRRNKTQTPLSIFPVMQGNRYHFRIIGAINIFAFKFSIDDHKLIAIASDGEYFEPKEVDYIIIHSGETYDFILDANQDNDNYWIRAHTLEANTTDHLARGILTYRNPSQLSWTTGYSEVVTTDHQCNSSSKCKILNCPFSKDDFIGKDKYECISLIELVSKPLIHPPKMPQFPPHNNFTHFLNFAVEKRNTVNFIRFKPPALPFATNCEPFDKDERDSKYCNVCQESDTSFNSMNSACQCTHVIKIASNAVYDPSVEPPSIWMVIAAYGSDFAHPVHLHGHAFHVIYIGDAKSDLKCLHPIGEKCAKLDWKNKIPDSVLSRIENNTVSVAAIKKDTIIVPGDKYIVIAFLADNPGYWFMHCHVEEHLLDGMALVIQEYPQNQQWEPPSGINNHGSFKWSTKEYSKAIMKGSTCKARQEIGCKPNKSLQVGEESYFVSIFVAFFTVGFLRMSY